MVPHAAVVVIEALSRLVVNTNAVGTPVLEIVEVLAGDAPLLLVLREVALRWNAWLTQICAIKGVPAAQNSVGSSDWWHVLLRPINSLTLEHIVTLIAHLFLLYILLATIETYLTDDVVLQEENCTNTEQEHHEVAWPACRAFMWFIGAWHTIVFWVTWGLIALLLRLRLVSRSTRLVDSFLRLVGLAVRDWQDELVVRVRVDQDQRCFKISYFQTTDFIGHIHCQVVVIAVVVSASHLIL